ncbi:unnamed protein product [Klebsiella pneumoniae subsp. rhinoscleromatis SB3432]|uniref:Putative transmembrane protein n=1 Tax=Klebsiella pneumoniae TaxID=573 RepID=A0A377XDL3_KLEPN|nr:unnamed protein product [Klebsiella pneumoniae subsp. rhinoscleromatis SB3432]STT73117.1 putative transmembrane protein [Klebsiella pneumoniae]STV52836.1 putative transmembrane protein [Klebsiella pneumoniae subsp. rhinoscleromatis]VTT31941.1 putative transmembrane protein [Klebsiella pneumoniae]
MNALLYALVVVIWGTTWIAIFLQQGPVAAPVSIFWRFAVASITMLAILLVTRRLRPLGAKDHLCCLLQGCCVFCFNFWCFYTAAAWINTGLESVIFSMAVLFNAINSFLFFRQQPPGRFWAPCFTWRCSARSSPLAPISLSLGASAPANPPTVRCCFRWSPYPFPPSMKGMSGTAAL